MAKVTRYIFSLCILIIQVSINSFGQTIHKSELEDFTGLIQFQDDGSISLLDYGINVGFSELKIPEGINPRIDDDYSFAYWPNKKLTKYVEIEEKDIMIVTFHNGGYESGTSFLSQWSINGDSLTFDHFFSSREFRFGFARLEQHYIIDKSGNIIFVVKDQFGDGGQMRGGFNFMLIDDKMNLYNLLERKFYGSSELESHVLYKFLWNEDLIIQTFEYSKSEFYYKDDPSQQHEFSRRVRDLKDSNYELIDLVELVENVMDNESDN